MAELTEEAEATGFEYWKVGRKRAKETEEGS